MRVILDANLLIQRREGDGSCDAGGRGGRGGGGIGSLWEWTELRDGLLASSGCHVAVAVAEDDAEERQKLGCVGDERSQGAALKQWQWEWEWEGDRSREVEIISYTRKRSDDKIANVLDIATAVADKEKCSLSQMKATTSTIEHCEDEDIVIVLLYKSKASTVSCQSENSIISEDRNKQLHNRLKVVLVHGSQRGKFSYPHEGPIRFVKDCSALSRMLQRESLFKRRRELSYSKVVDERAKFNAVGDPCGHWELDEVLVAVALLPTRRRIFLRRGLMPLLFLASNASGDDIGKVAFAMVDSDGSRSEGIILPEMDVDTAKKSWIACDVIVMHRTTDELLSIPKSVTADGRISADGNDFMCDIRYGMKVAENVDANGDTYWWCFSSSITTLVKRVNERKAILVSSSSSFTITILDAPERLALLLNRDKMMVMLQSLPKSASSDTNGGPSVRGAKSIRVDSYDESVFRHSTTGLESVFKPNQSILLKPLLAAGSHDSHVMNVVKDVQSLWKCVTQIGNAIQNLEDVGMVVTPVRPPVIAQEYIAHAGTVYKVYVIGEDIHVAKRRSFAINDEPHKCCKDSIDFPKMLTFNSLKDLPKVSFTTEDYNTFYLKSDSHDEEVVKADLDQKLIRFAASWIRTKTGLTIFGVDVLLDKKSGDHVIVDVNYLPSFLDVDSCTLKYSMARALFINAKTSSLRQNKIIVGFAITDKKQRSMLTAKLLHSLESANMTIKMIDWEAPLSDQLPFNILFHKIPNTVFLQRLEQFSVAYPDVCIIERPRAVKKILNRSTMVQSCCKDEVDSRSDAIVMEMYLKDLHYTVKVPPESKPISSSDVDNLQEVVGGFLPAMVKPMMECDHDVTMVESIDAFDKIMTEREEFIVQRYIPHDEHIFKIYVLGDMVHLDVRQSDYSIAKESCLYSKQHGKMCSLSSLEKLFVQRLVLCLRERLGMNLFNVELVRKCGSGCNSSVELYIIDVNYFPGYYKIGNYESAFVNYIRLSL